MKALLFILFVLYGELSVADLNPYIILQGQQPYVMTPFEVINGDNSRERDYQEEFERKQQYMYQQQQLDNQQRLIELEEREQQQRNRPQNYQYNFE